MLLYANITKAEEQDDGTLIVDGIASSEAVDAVGEVVTANAMRKAIPAYMQFGAVREMHDSKKAAGTALSCVVNDAGQTLLSAKVVDPVAVLKVKTGVYKGFSIGGKSIEKNGSTIEELSLSEISLVDRPCNPEAIFSVVKIDPHKQESTMDEEKLMAILGAIQESLEGLNAKMGAKAEDVEDPEAKAKAEAAKVAEAEAEKAAKADDIQKAHEAEIAGLKKELAAAKASKAIKAVPVTKAEDTAAAEDAIVKGMASKDPLEIMMAINAPRSV